MSSSGITSRDGSIRIVGGGVTVDLSATGGGGGVELGGDIGGTNTDPTVIGIQTIPVSSSTPTTGEALILSGGVWTPTAIPLGVSPGTGIGVNASAGIYTISNTGVTAFNTRTGAITLAAADVEGTFNAKGDIFLGTGSGAGTILPIGTTGQVATVAGGTVVWATPAAGGVTSVTAAAGGSLVATPTTGAVVISRAALTGDVTASADSNTTAIKSSVHLSSSPTTTTQSPLDNSTKIATTAYTDLAIGVETTRAEAAEVTLTPTTGWIPDSNTWTYSSVSGKTSILTVNADLTTVIGLGDRIQLTNNSQTQYFIVTAISVATGTTTITLYGGASPIYLNASYAHAGGAVTSITVAALVYSVPSGATLRFANGDTATTTASAAVGATSLAISSVTPSTTNGGWFSGQYVNGSNFVLANSAITNPFYSHAKVPFGFASDPMRWTEALSDNQLYSQSSPVSGTYYSTGLGGSSLLLPIGVWRLLYEANVYAQGGASSSSASIQVALSTSASTLSDGEFAAFVLSNANTLANVTVFGGLHREKLLNLAAATTYFLIGKTASTGQTDITVAGTDGYTVIRAMCAYL